MRQTRFAEFTTLAFLIAAALVPMIPQVMDFDNAFALQETWSPVIEAGPTHDVCRFA